MDFFSVLCNLPRTLPPIRTLHKGTHIRGETWRGIFRDHRITKERKREKQAAPEDAIQEQTEETKLIYLSIMADSSSWIKSPNGDSSASITSPQSVVSAFTMASSTSTLNPNVGIAIDAINSIEKIRDLTPIYDALEAKVRPTMEQDVKKYGWTKTSQYKNPCATCHMKQGFF